MFDPAGAPLGVERLEPALHLDRHAEALGRVLLDAARVRVAEEHDDRIADELVDRAAVAVRDRRHLGQVLVEQGSQVLRLQPLGGAGEVLDVGEEDGELLALGGDRHVALALKRLRLRGEVAAELAERLRSTAC